MQYYHLLLHRATTTAPLTTVAVPEIMDSAQARVCVMVYTVLGIYILYCAVASVQ
jgi:hypothetical protein